MARELGDPVRGVLGYSVPPYAWIAPDQCALLIIYILPYLSWVYQSFLNHINRTELFSVINVVLYMHAYSSCF